MEQSNGGVVYMRGKKKSVCVCVLGVGIGEMGGGERGRINT